MQRDNEMMTQAATCAFFGGDRPIHYSTLYRGVAAGRYPKPVHVGPNTSRWVRSECEAARQKLIDGRDDGFSTPPPRNPGRPETGVTTAAKAAAQQAGVPVAHGRRPRTNEPEAS